jgi:predicted nucleic acid-binding protein
MIFIDTGYLISALDPSDRFHNRAVAWGQVLTRQPQVTSTAVVLELFNYFSGTYRRPYLASALQTLLASPGFDLVHVDRDLWDRGLALFDARPDKHWSLTDCISFTLMTDRGITRALAYDHHFEQAGFEALLRRDPPTHKTQLES